MFSFNVRLVALFLCFYYSSFHMPCNSCFIVYLWLQNANQWVRFVGLHFVVSGLNAVDMSMDNEANVEFTSCRASLRNATFVYAKDGASLTINDCDIGGVCHIFLMMRNESNFLIAFLCFGTGW